MRKILLVFLVLLISLFSVNVFAEANDFDITSVSYSYMTYDYPMYPNVPYQSNYYPAGSAYSYSVSTYPTTINPYTGTYYNYYPAYSSYTYAPYTSSYYPAYSSYSNYYPYNNYNTVSYTNGQAYVSFTW